MKFVEKIKSLEEKKKSSFRWYFYDFYYCIRSKLYLNENASRMARSCYANQSFTFSLFCEDLMILYLLLLMFGWRWFCIVSSVGCIFVEFRLNLCNYVFGESFVIKINSYKKLYGIIKPLFWYSNFCGIIEKEIMSLLSDYSIFVI